MMDMGINSALTLLQLRDVVLARAEEDVSREVVLRLPIAEHNVATLIAQASSRESDVPEQDQHAAVRLNPRELGQ
jgi:hypothetical protein